MNLENFQLQVFELERPGFFKLWLTWTFFKFKLLNFTSTFLHFQWAFPKAHSSVLFTPVPALCLSPSYVSFLYGLFWVCPASTPTFWLQIRRQTKKWKMRLRICGRRIVDRFTRLVICSQTAWERCVRQRYRVYWTGGQKLYRIRVGVVKFWQSLLDVDIQSLP